MTLPISLVPDCGNCFALCCTALGFARSADFAIDKDVGEPCPNLAADFGCSIHAELRPRGFKGCTVFDCFGAGQHVAQGTYGGRDWRSDPASAAQMFAVFTVLRQLHEYLWYLSQASRVAPDAELRAELDEALRTTAELTDGAAADVVQLDAESYRALVNDLLFRTSAAVRAAVPRHREHPALHRRPDLIGAQLDRADLRGVNLRGAYLIAADLTGADLRAADLLGADLRDAALGGADLSTSLFVTQPQLNSAIGDQKTRLPGELARPAHWPSR